MEGSLLDEEWGRRNVSVLLGGTAAMVQIG